MKVETDELLSIGRFARLSGLTVKALRHYEAEGLIRPARVDEWTGYRYYSPAQARDAITIRRLRELELPLDEIASVLHADPDTVRERLAVHRARLQGRAVEVQQLVRALDLLIEGKEPLVQETIVEPRIEELPATGSTASSSVYSPRISRTARAVSSGVPTASTRTASSGPGGSSVSSWLSSSDGGM